jgi:hypothetical protein
MARKRVLSVAALVAWAGLVAWAADVDGKWTAEVQGRGGNTVTQTLTLKATGDKLTGNLEGGRGGPVEISDGTVKGNDVAFKIVREFGGNTFEQNYKGTLTGDELKLTVEGGRGGPQNVTFKRAK